MVAVGYFLRRTYDAKPKIPKCSQQDQLIKTLIAQNKMGPTEVSIVIPVNTALR